MSEVTRADLDALETKLLSVILENAEGRNRADLMINEQIRSLQAAVGQGVTAPWAREGNAARIPAEKLADSDAGLYVLSSAFAIPDHDPVTLTMPAAGAPGDGVRQTEKDRMFLAGNAALAVPDDARGLVIAADGVYGIALEEVVHITGHTGTFGEFGLALVHARTVAGVEVEIERWGWTFPSVSISGSTDDLAWSIAVPPIALMKDDALFVEWSYGGEPSASVTFDLAVPERGAQERRLDLHRYGAVPTPVATVSNLAALLDFGPGIEGNIVAGRLRIEAQSQSTAYARRAAWRADASFTEADFKAGAAVVGMTSELAMPANVAGSGNGYLGVWVEGADRRLEQIFVGDFDLFPRFTRAALVIDGVAGALYTSTLFDAANLAGRRIRLG